MLKKLTQSRILGAGESTGTFSERGISTPSACVWLWRSTNVAAMKMAAPNARSGQDARRQVSGLRHDQAEVDLFIVVFDEIIVIGLFVIDNFVIVMLVRGIIFFRIGVVVI